MSVEPEPGPKTGSIVMAVGSIAGAVTPRLELRLASVAGAPDMVYPWPLTVGKGKIFSSHDSSLTTSIVRLFVNLSVFLCQSTLFINQLSFCKSTFFIKQLSKGCPKKIGFTLATLV